MKHNEKGDQLFLERIMSVAKNGQARVMTDEERVLRFEDAEQRQGYEGMEVE